MDAGTKLGPYEIRELLGEGGMGKVYLAEDTRLGRRVALKVLPEEYAADEDRRARFEREARATAALNHPHVAAVHDVGTSEGVHYIVQEYLEGRSLRELLAEGRLSLRRSLQLATEIAEALGAAHAADIVHRDLKPDNVIVTGEGHAKVLDFGLAKLMEGAFEAPSGDPDRTRSPTVVGTAAGQILGTAGYMAPEQVEGGEVDHRADLFAFGCVLYEMLTGQQPFAGKSVHDTLHRIVREEPRDVEELTTGLPLKIGWVLEKCLRKARADRYQDARDLVVDLRTVGREVEAGRVAPSGDDDGASRSAGPGISGDESAAAGPVWLPGPRVPALAAVAVVVVAVALTAILWSEGPSRDVDRPVHRLRIQVTDLAEPRGIGVPIFGISPDGRHVAYLRAGTESGSSLVHRRTDELEATPVEGVPPRAGAAPAFSPDNRWIAFVDVVGALWRVARQGGEPILVDSEAFGHAWIDAETLAYSRGTAVYRAPLTAAAPQRMVELPGAEDRVYLLTDVLPGGRRALLVRLGSRQAIQGGAVVMASLETGEVLSEIAASGSNPQWMPSGHVVYARGSSLEAVPVDPDTGRVQGAPMPVAPDVFIDRVFGLAHYDVAAEAGTLVYLSGADFVALTSELVWVDPESGAEEVVRRFDGADASRPRLSPDGRRVALQIASESLPSIRVYDLERGSEVRLSHEGLETDPVWTRDGSEIVYSAVPPGASWETLVIRRADGVGDAELLGERERHENAYSVSPDGQELAIYARTARTDRDIYVLSRSDDWSPEPILVRDFNDRSPAFSPDGDWIAYTSDESGRDQVYVLRYPGLDERHSISTDGGREPAWSSDGERIYYRNGDAFWAVDVETEAGFEAGAPRKLFEGPYRAEIPVSGSRSYDVAADGRFLVLRNPAGTLSVESLRVVLNWSEELERLSPPTGRDRPEDTRQ